jgi:hypothetical protein
MTPSDKNNSVMNRLLEEMTYFGRRLDELQNKVSGNWEIIKTLKAENKRYRDVFAVLPQRFFLKDERLSYVLCSEMFASDLSRTVDEVIGKVDENLVPFQLAENRRQQEMRILQSGQAEEAEEILIIDGHHRAFITIKAPVKNADGCISGLFGVSVDISLYWRKVVELECLNQQMENLLASQAQQILSERNNLEYVLSRMSQQEEEFKYLRVDYEMHLSLKDVELAQLRNELKRQPAERDEMLQTLQRKIHELQNFIDVARTYIDRLKNTPD